MLIVVGVNLDEIANDLSAPFSDGPFNLPDSEFRMFYVSAHNN